MVIFLQILKIIGIILLCILAFLILLLFFILFVPIRYHVKGQRKITDDTPIKVRVKISWLLHFLTAAYIYPEDAYLKVKVLGIPVFSTKEKEVSKQTDKSETKDSPTTNKQTVLVSEQEKKEQENLDNDKENKNATDWDPIKELAEAEKTSNSEEESTDEPTIRKFFRKLWQILKNIKYTIQKIYDKIKEILRNIRYYINVVKSETFQNTFLLCRDELFYTLRRILPGKLSGNFVIGTGDPASTAQILAIHGILYPFIGNHITITPDFENTIIEGDFYFKGKITIFQLLKTAIRLYFNKDLKKVIRLLKREAVNNGRK